MKMYKFKLFLKESHTIICRNKAVVSCLKQLGKEFGMKDCMKSIV